MSREDKSIGILRVSIGMPVYNGEPFIRQALESLLAQTFKDFELIISDNASIDDTGNICLEYAATDARIRYFRQTANIGAAKNFEFVLNESRHEYFMWAAADDYYGPEHVEYLVAELDLHSKAVVAMSGTIRLLPTGEIQDIIKYKESESPNSLSNMGLAWRLVSGKLYHVYIYGLFRANFLKNSFNEVPQVKGADRLFICAAALAANFRYVDQITYFRRVYKGHAYGRYYLSDMHLAKIYSDAFGSIKASLALGPYLLRSNIIPARRKLFIPFVVIRYTLFIVLHAFKNVIKGLLR